jgi:hypothetical protein
MSWRKNMMYKIKDLVLSLAIPNVRLVEWMLRLKFKGKKFVFNSEELEYFFHSYNNFGRKVRSVEIPIIKYYLNKFPHDRVLEIGNVTKYYYDLFRDFKRKDTVDKYELAYDVYNVDIKDFKSDVKYDFIYSISTFEHMDSDGGGNPDYSPIVSDAFSSYAFAYMNRVINDLLSKGGVFVLTFPIGQDNCEIDQSLFNKEYESFKTSKVKFFFLKQLRETKWKQVDITIEELAKKKPKWHTGEHYLCVMEIKK